MNVRTTMNVLAVLLLAFGARDSTAAPVKVLPEGMTVVDLSSEGTLVRVEIESHVLPLRQPRLMPNQVPFTCPDGEGLCATITDLVITVDGERVWVNQSAFSGLEAVNSVDLTKRDEGYMLSFTASDAAHSYLVWIEFDDERVTRRKLASGLNETEILEDTIYTAPTPLD